MATADTPLAYNLELHARRAACLTLEGLKGSADLPGWPHGHRRHPSGVQPGSSGRWGASAAKQLAPLKVLFQARAPGLQGSLMLVSRGFEPALLLSAVRGEAVGRGACPSRRLRLVYRANHALRGDGRAAQRLGWGREGGCPPFGVPCYAAPFCFARFLNDMVIKTGLYIFLVIKAVKRGLGDLENRCKALLRQGKAPTANPSSVYKSSLKCL